MSVQPEKGESGILGEELKEQSVWNKIFGQKITAIVQSQNHPPYIQLP
jgi:hypothetical protein